jgi:hypothetical protein
VGRAAGTGLSCAATFLRRLNVFTWFFNSGRRRYPIKQLREPRRVLKHLRPMLPSYLCLIGLRLARAKRTNLLALSPGCFTALINRIALFGYPAFLRMVMASCLAR